MKLPMLDLKKINRLNLNKKSVLNLEKNRHFINKFIPQENSIFTNLTDRKRSLDASTRNCYQTQKIFRINNSIKEKLSYYTKIKDESINCKNTTNSVNSYNYKSSSRTSINNGDNNYNDNESSKSDNYEKGLKLISRYRLDRHLGISKYNKIKKTSDLLGMWAQIDYSDNYSFTKLEKETIKKIRELLIYGKIDLFALYKYGNYIASIVSEILDIDKKEISDMYESLPIYSKEDIKLNVMNICTILNISPSNKTKDILNDIEYKIIIGELKNTKKDIEKYIKESSGD